MANSASVLKQITRDNNKLTLQLQKLANANTAKTFTFNSSEAAKQRLYNAAEASAARAWQEKMSNTSHQREVADLKAAGLNPVLSANSGAQSYTTTAASASNASGTADSSAVGALAGIRSSENSARASIYGSDASLKASQSMASAQRYAADRSYQAALASAAAARYSADKHYDAQKYSADRSYETAMNKPVGSWASLADKYFGESTFKQLASVASQDSIQAGIKFSTSKFGLPKLIKSIVTSPRFDFRKVLTSGAIANMRHMLNSNGYELSWYNFQNFAKFILTQDERYVMNIKKTRRSYYM